MEKERIHVCHGKEAKTGSIVPVLACVLNQLCISNDQMPFSPKEANSKFHALRIPYINLPEYLERIAKYSGCSTECLVLALVYIDRIIQSSQNFIVNSYCIHRLIITSVMLAAKFFDDHYYNNAYYAKVGGVTYSEMNGLEVEFLFMLNFDLFVTTETYKQYYDELWNHANSIQAHLCGCINAKVPLLILPRFEESRKNTPVAFDHSDLLDDDDGDLDITSDSSPPPSPTKTSTTSMFSTSTSTSSSPKLEIPLTHCGTKIQKEVVQPQTAEKPRKSSITSTTSAPKSVNGMQQQSQPRFEASNLPTTVPPSTWSSVPSPVPKPQQQLHPQYNRIIAPPPTMNRQSSGGSSNKRVHEQKNSDFGNSSTFAFQNIPVTQEEYPMDTFATTRASKPLTIATTTASALKGRDDVMLDIVDSHILSGTTTPSTFHRATIRQQNTTMRVVESPPMPSTTTGAVGFYGDIPTFLVGTEEEDTDDSKALDISPSFHPYGNGKKPNLQSSDHRRWAGWTEPPDMTNHHHPRIASRLPPYRGNLPTSTNLKRKENRDPTNTFWQSVVPVY